MNKPILNLTNANGNAFTILGLAQRASRKAGWTPEEWQNYKTEAMKGDYDHLLQTTMKYFEVK